MTNSLLTLVLVTNIAVYVPNILDDSHGRWGDGTITSPDPTEKWEVATVTSDAPVRYKDGSHVIKPFTILSLTNHFHADKIKGWIRDTNPIPIPQGAMRQVARSNGVANWFGYEPKRRDVSEILDTTWKSYLRMGAAMGAYMMQHHPERLYGKTYGQIGDEIVMEIDLGTNSIIYQETH